MPKGEDGETMPGSWRIGAGGGVFYAESDAATEGQKHQQLVEIKTQARDELFQFVSMIIQAEITLDFTHVVDNTQTLVALDGSAQSAELVSVGKLSTP